MCKEGGLCDLLVAVYVRCLRNSENNIDVNDNNSDNINANSVNNNADNNDSNNELVVAATNSNSKYEAFADVAGKRVLTVMLTIVFGSLCLPEHINDSSHKSKNSATNSSSNDKLPYVNQQYLGNTLNLCNHLITCFSNSIVSDENDVSPRQNTALTVGNMHSDILTLEATLRTMYYLILSHEHNQFHLGTIECNQLVVSALKHNLDKPNIVYYSCLLISALAHNNKNNSLVLGEQNVCETVVSALNR